MTRFRNKLFSALTMLVLFGVVLLRIVSCGTPFVTWPELSEYEGRVYQPFPAASTQRIASGAFQADFEQFAADHVPFRDRLYSVNGIINYLLLHRSQTDRVIIGKDGWLFYNGAASNDGDCVADYQGINLYSNSELEELAQKLNLTSRKLEERGQEFVLMIVPNKATLYGEKYLPDSYGNLADYRRSEQVRDYLLEHADLRLVYAEDDLIRAKEELPDNLYFKSDSHWNGLACYLAAHMLLAELRIDLPELEQYTARDRGLESDLATMMGIQALFRETEYDINYTPITNQDTRNVFVVHDSCFNDVVPYLEDSFTRVDSVLYKDYIFPDTRTNQADVVVVEIAERYLDRLWELDID